MNMKILHVNKFFDFHGGAEVYLHRLMRAQELAGNEVHVLSTRSEQNAASIDARYFVQRFSLDRKEGAARDLQKAVNFIWNRDARRSMERMIREIRPDVIHLHNLYHHLSSSVLSPIRASGIPCVQTLHDYKLACPNYRMFVEGKPCERCHGGKYLNVVRHRCLFPSFLPNVLAAMEMGMTKGRQSYERTVRMFLCPSHFMKNKMEEWGEPPSKMAYLPNPVDLPETTAARGGGYLLYVGRLWPEKGVESFLRAAMQIPEMPVKIVGRGPEEERLRSLVRENGASHIEFLGFQPPVEVARIRQRAEAVVLPTVMYENASGTLLEAMADGLPCLATKIGGNTELVDDEQSGFLVLPNATDDWLRILRRFQALPIEIRRAMGERGREKIQSSHLWSDHLNRLQTIYREVGARG